MPPKDKTTATPGTRKSSRKTTPALPQTAVSPPAARPPIIKAPVRKKGKGRAPLDPILNDNGRPLARNAPLEALIRTRVRDLEYIHASIDNVVADDDLKQRLQNGLDVL